MKVIFKLPFAAAMVAASTLIATGAKAAIVTVTCTGMLDFDIYKIDTDQESQVVEGIGESKVSLTSDAILLEGAYGIYRFDLNAGTKYHDDNDTGIYCTYKGLPDS